MPVGKSLYLIGKPAALMLIVSTMPHASSWLRTCNKTILIKIMPQERYCYKSLTQTWYSLPGYKLCLK